jgi:hypothetical protein
MLAKAPNRKRAVEYLALSGAVPITVIEHDGVCSISAGKVVPGDHFGTGTTTTWWTAGPDAARIASRATLRASLTPDDIAIARASAAMVRLDAMIESMRQNGQLREFNRQYKLRRAAALADGRGYMNFSVAMARLKLALVPALQTGKPLTSIFDQVFR